MQSPLNLLKIVLEALFPLSPAESELFSLSPEEAYTSLRPAPDFSGLAVPLPGAASVFAYKDERVARLVWNIKYKKSAEAVKIGGHALFQALKNSHHDRPVLILPIPITSKRRKERGYNQCELLLDEIERLQNRTSICNLIFERNLLVRTGDASEQKLKDRKERTQSTHTIFSVRPDDMLPYSHDMTIIVIDDVITTGCTMHEAIGALRKRGFKNISALSLAH